LIELRRSLGARGQAARHLGLHDRQLAGRGEQLDVAAAARPEPKVADDCIRMSEALASRVLTLPWSETRGQECFGIPNTAVIEPEGRDAGPMPGGPIKNQAKHPTLIEEDCWGKDTVRLPAASKKVTYALDRIHQAVELPRFISKPQYDVGRSIR
jgi:hypothetical protein